MAEGGFHEKLSIRDSARSLKKYGSTSKHMTRQENLIKHFVLPTDTLQGIALKYEVTTEQIRRANRLWASDSLFLREYLLIPIASDSSFNKSESHQIQKNENNNITSPISPIYDPCVEEQSIDDFLSHIDNSIANTKKEVRKAQGNSEYVKNTDINTTYNRRKHAIARLRQSTNSLLDHIPSPDLLTTSPTLYQSLLPQTNTQPHTVPMVVTQTGRKLRSSLQRLEQQQDEMFEL